LNNRRFEVGIFALLLAACAAFSAACGSSSSDTAGPTGGRGGDDPGAAGSGNDVQDITLEFNPTGSITMSPKDTRELTVRAVFGDPKRDDAPPASQIRVRFGLTATDEAMLDAVLDTSEALTDADGLAHVMLTAPSKPIDFSVRASNPRSAVIAQQGVIVTATRKTTLSVQPSYTGHRPRKEWIATAQPGVTCADLGSPPPDGDRVGSAPPNQPITLTDVPVGMSLAVTVRVGHYITGCADVPALNEGEGNQVLVYANDRALNLAATNLSLHFGATDVHPGFDKLLQTSAAAAESVLLGNAKSDITALLDGMRETALGLDRDAFDLTRADKDWDGALESVFGKTATRRLRDPAQRWLNAGLAALNAPDALSGKLSPLGLGASFIPSGVGGASPDDAGFPGFFGAIWSADSNDSVLLGMELNWEPSRLVTALAVAPALAELPEADSVERALSLSVDCAQVGQVLLAAGSSPGLIAFASCDESCAVKACESAVAAAWARAQQSSESEIATLSVTASAKATVGDDARATQLSGSWVGELSTENGSAQVSGALSAE
jgi:hypothetical protein